jgi:ParB family chromosome partitioning protein
MKNMLEKQADVRNNVIPNPSADQRQKVESVFQDWGLMSWLSLICNRLPLLNLPKDVLDKLRWGKIAYTKALAIARVKDQAQPQILLNQAVEEELSLKPDQQSPQVRLRNVHQRLLKARLWEDSRRWSQAQALLAKLEALLDP